MGFSDDQESSESDKEFEVGYKRPPKHSRFRPGQSGSPKGKPLGAKHAATVLKHALLEVVDVKQGGRAIKTTIDWVIATQIVNQAMRGDYVSVQMLFKYADLDRKFHETEREYGGLSPEAGELIRRALCGYDYEPEIPTGGDSASGISLLPDHASDPPQSDQNDVGQVYRVGYGKPPIHTRFQKGQSGNPAGRPRKSRNLTILIQWQLVEEVTITENGRKRSVLKLDAIIMQIVKKAASGNSRFQALLLKYAPSLDLVSRRRPIPPKVAFERVRRSLLAH
jgi:uncharacterized protein DUF5681